MNILTILIVLALLATVVSFGWGIGSMIRGGKYDAEHSTQLMSARVGFQALAIVLMIIAIVMSF